MSHEHSADWKFFRTFSAVIAGLAAAGILFGIIANVYEGENQDIKSRQFLMAAPAHPAGQTNTSAGSSTPTSGAAVSESKGHSG